MTRAIATDEILSRIGSIDVETVALVDQPVELPGGLPGKAIIQRDDPGDIQIETEAPSRQLLVLSESYHRGWSATVDGTPCEVLRAYGDFMGCVVGSGRHQVEFRFEPRSLSQGRRLSWLGLALSFGWLAFSLLRSSAKR